jgi:hypothetical protein
MSGTSSGSNSLGAGVFTHSEIHDAFVRMQSVIACRSRLLDVRQEAGLSIRIVLLPEPERITINELQL